MQMRVYYPEVSARSSPIMRQSLLLAAKALLISTSFLVPVAMAAGDSIFSGPQPGEQIKGFKVIDVAAESTERDPVQENGGAPTALVFIHAVERSLVPLLRVIDEYGARRKERIKTEVIFLAADRLTGAPRC